MTINKPTEAELTEAELTQKVAALERQLAEYKIAKIALDAQNAMLDNLVKMAETPELEDMLKITIQHALEISNNLTGAEGSCLVLLSDKGKVTDTILEHRRLSANEQQSFARSVLNQNYISWLCRHKRIALIADTKNSDRWQTNPGDPEVAKSVMCVPILKGQKVMGILTLIHSAPGFFKNESANLMQALGKQIALAVEFARFYGELETYSNALQIEVEKGKELQRDFLPHEDLYLPGWQIASFFKPAKRMAGDFYDTFTLPNNLAAIVIGDVCDKGVGAALFMGLFRSLLRVFAGQLLSLETRGMGDGEFTEIDALKAVVMTNNYIAQNHSNLYMFATLFFGVLNPKTGVLTYINGGHEEPIVMRASGVTERLEATGPVVGPIGNIAFSSHQVELEEGDILIGYTDGVPDARSIDGSFFSEKRLLSVLREAASTDTHLSARSLVNYLKDEIESHVDEADPFDDITILVLQKLHAR